MVNTNLTGKQIQEVSGCFLSFIILIFFLNFDRLQQWSAQLSVLRLQKL